MTTLAPIHTAKLSAEQYFMLGEDPPGVHLELIDGELIVSPSPNLAHARVIVELISLLNAYIKKHHLGQLYPDTDVVFTTRTVRRPDIAFFSHAKLAQMPPDHLTLPPDLCIEVLSPFNVDDDRINKFNLYQSHGVAHYWIIDPENKTAECFALQNDAYAAVAQGKGGDTVHFPPFTDLPIPLLELFAFRS
jgi:Uma2 family endonuclease